MANELHGTTIIATGTKFQGTIDTKAKMHLDGDFDGQIKSQSTVTVGVTGFFKGEINAKKLVISGKFEGTADCESIDILAGGKTIGDIVTNNLVIEPKASFEGHSKIKALDPKDKSTKLVQSPQHTTAKIG